MQELAPQYDLLLLEGHKDTPLVDKVWLLKDEGETCPPEAVNIRHVLRRDEDRAGFLMNLLTAWLQAKNQATPLYAGILVGGESRRMGQPKHLLPLPDGRTWLEGIVTNIPPSVKQIVLLGGKMPWQDVPGSRAALPESMAHLPLLPDITDKQGPLAGMLAAMRWQPAVSWLFLSCDMPLLTTTALQWVVDQRAPGVWGVLPHTVGTALRRRPSTETSASFSARGAGRPTQSPAPYQTEHETVEPLPGWYDFRARLLLEQCHGPSALADREKIISPPIPPEYATAWTNVNNPEELQAITKAWFATKGA